MDKSIKLTENQFKQYLVETIQQILTELDWKTAMNYAKGRRKQGNRKKAYDGEEYARNAFNDKHMPSFDDAHEYAYAQGKDKRDYIQNDMGMSIMNSHGAQMNLHQRRDGFDTHPRDEYENTEFQKFGSLGKGDENYSAEYSRADFGNDGRFYGYSREDGVMPKAAASPNFANRYNKATRDLKNYYSGKAKYNKGKGWEE